MQNTQNTENNIYTRIGEAITSGGKYDIVSANTEDEESILIEAGFEKVGAIKDGEKVLSLYKIKVKEKEIVKTIEVPVTRGPLSPDIWKINPNTTPYTPNTTPYTPNTTPYTPNYWGDNYTGTPYNPNLYNYTSCTSCTSQSDKSTSQNTSQSFQNSIKNDDAFSILQSYFFKNKD